MGREYKFRGRSCESGDWIYGSLSQLPNGTFITDGYVTKSVYPSTVGLMVYRFGNMEVYEGDFIMSDWNLVYKGKGRVIGKVVFSPLLGIRLDGYFSEVGNDKAGVAITPGDSIDRIEPLLICCRVIGNIYDNKDLVKEICNDIDG